MKKLTTSITILLLFTNAILFSATAFFEPGRGSFNITTIYDLKNTRYAINTNNSVASDTPGNLGYIGVKDAKNNDTVRIVVSTGASGLNFVYKNNPNVVYPYQIRFSQHARSSTFTNQVDGTTITTSNELLNFSSTKGWNNNFKNCFIGIMIGLGKDLEYPLNTGDYEAQLYVDVYLNNSLQRTYSLTLQGVYQTAQEESDRYYFEIRSTLASNRINLRQGASMPGAVASTYVNVATLNFMSEFGSPYQLKYQMHLSPTASYQDTVSHFQFKKTGTENSPDTPANSINYKIRVRDINSSTIQDGVGLSGTTQPAFQVSDSMFHRYNVTADNYWWVLDANVDIQLTENVTNLTPGEYYTDIFVTIIKD